jgi:hypothetical protein
MRQPELDDEMSQDEMKVVTEAVPHGNWVTDSLRSR